AVSFDQINMRQFERFGDDLQSECVANLCHDFPSFFAESLKCVRRGSWFPHAASKEARTALLNCFCYSERLLTIFDRARAGDDGELASADRRAVDLHHGFLRAQIERDQLVWFGDTDDFRNTGQIFKTPAVDWTLVSGNPDRCARGPGHRMRAESDCFDYCDHCVDFARSGARFHHDQHILKMVWVSS